MEEVAATSDQMECEAGAIRHPQAIHGGEDAVFSTGQVYVSTAGVEIQTTIEAHGLILEDLES